ncbi:MAG: acyl-ACP thioesterase [Treponema sp.]|jgi:acyl-ACP thioesterase|nr:acyl-ACP thioesterase [Treponema sp.]
MADIGMQEISVGFGDIDTSDRLTLARTFDYFQEAAINHAEELGVGRAALAQSRQAWILSRIGALIEKRPQFREKIIVRSWPRSWEKLFAKRDYDIRDAAGNVLVRGRSGWLVVDIETHRPLRPQPIVETLPKNEGCDALNEIASLAVRENLTLAGERTSCYSDIDYNGHVNNARYVQWIQDVTDPDLLVKADSMRLDINYISEAKLNETVELWKAPIEQDSASSAGFAGFAYEGRKKNVQNAPRNAGGTTVFRAELRLYAGIS